jgi:hypothetical protein
MKAWAESLDVDQIKGLGPAMKKEIILGLHDEDPVELEGLKKVWCFSVLPKGRFGLIHFVETENHSRTPKG